jgi:hypothetical protein
MSIIPVMREVEVGGSQSEAHLGISAETLSAKETD